MKKKKYTATISVNLYADCDREAILQAEMKAQQLTIGDDLNPVVMEVAKPGKFNKRLLNLDQVSQDDIDNHKEQLILTN